MTTDRELMQQALDALEYVIQSVGGNAPESFDVWFQKTQVPAEALRARLAQPEPEPVAQVRIAEDYHAHVFWMVSPLKLDQRYLYAAPRSWKGLADEEILEEYRQSYGDDGNLTDVYFARAIEAKLKEKNIG